MRVSQMRRLHLFAPALLAGAALLAPAGASAGEPPGDVQIGVDPDPSVYGGTAAQTCGWPTAVYLSFGFAACSGTLVHPEIVITAAHCPDSTSGRNAQVGFGEGFGGGEREISATCYSNPGWTGQVGGTDYGYCKLSQPVTDVPIIPPAWGCDVTALTPGREVVIVGFGQSDNGGSGSKREVTTQINSINSEAWVGGMGKDACQGDSGGPVFIKLKSEFGGDDTWRAFGITSGGGQCGQGGIFSLMHMAIPWIEEHSGVDITPCQDSNGDWAPTPECGDIPLDPANGQGSWATGCSDGPTSGFGGLCGDPFGSGDDQDPPSVEIVAPANQTTYMIPDGEPNVDVTVTVAADDGEGFGVSDVRLVINGQEFPGNVDGSEPYEWDLVFGPGGYVIEATATDYTGNVSAPDVIAIGVDEEPPPLPGDSGDGDGDSGDGDTSGDTDGGDETGPGPGIDTTGGPGYEAEIGCACATSGSGPGSDGGGILALLGLLGLPLLRRRRA